MMAVRSITIGNVGVSAGAWRWAALCFIFLAIAAAFQIFDGIQTVSTGALRGLGETRVPMFANLVGYWVLGLPLGFVLCFVLKKGVIGLWIGLTVALVVIASSLLYRWNRDSTRAI